MDEKLKSMERMRKMLGYHRAACYIAAWFIVLLSIYSSVTHHGTLKENIAFGVLGLGFCIFSLLTGAKQKAVLERKVEQYKESIELPKAEVVRPKPQRSRSVAKSRKRR